MISLNSTNSPLGFDLEWRVIYRRGAPERPAATVQICDSRMILVIQVTAMKGMDPILCDDTIPS